MDTLFVDSEANDAYRVYMDDGLLWEILYSVTANKWFVIERKTYSADDFGANMRHVYNSVGKR